jgi:hypothetical protein
MYTDVEFVCRFALNYPLNLRCALSYCRIEKISGIL